MRLLRLLPAWLALAVSSNALIADPPDLAVKRDDAPLTRCGLSFADESSSTTTTRRSVGVIRLERNATSSASTPRIKTPVELFKRMELPGRAAMGTFYEHELPKIKKRIVDSDTGRLATDMSAAVMQEYSKLTQKEVKNGGWSTGIQGLKGCTTLYIISRKAVYGTHWWENISFDPGRNSVWRIPEDGDSTNLYTDEELFKLTVLDMIRDGGDFHDPLEADKIEDDYIKAYLIRPKKVWRQYEEDPNLPDYREQWDQIRALVGELVPTLQDESRWQEIIYTTVSKDSILDKRATTRGRNLFKYDPKHPIGGGQTQAWAMLWVEGRRTPYHSDKW